MAPLTTHLVIGERVFAHLPRLGPQDYGAFLLGCVLVDVHVFSDIARRDTHFAKRLVGKGANAFHQSCANFLGRRDALLRRPWHELTRAERAFVAGYLCHLAADEEWKQFDWLTLQREGINWWTDLPVPGNVIVTVFDVLSKELFLDYVAVSSALRDVAVPDAFTHVPLELFQATWKIARVHVLGNSTLESFLELLGRLGKTDAEIEAERRQHERCWQDAADVIHTGFGGVPTRVEAMVQRALDTMPRLWASLAQNHD